MAPHGPFHIGKDPAFVAYLQSPRHALENSQPKHRLPNPLRFWKTDNNGLLATVFFHCRSGTLIKARVWNPVEGKPETEKQKKIMITWPTSSTPGLPPFPGPQHHSLPPPTPGPQSLQFPKDPSLPPPAPGPQSYILCRG